MSGKSHNIESEVLDIVDDINKDIQEEYFNESKKVLKVVDQFVRRKKLLLYGGFSINFLLPPKSKIYKKRVVKDYDCFSKNALADANELANILKKKGFKYIKVSKALHENTFKVFAEFISVLDITQVKDFLFDKLFEISRDENKLFKFVKNMRYPVVPYTFLISKLHFELARPINSYFRWDKIYVRLQKFATLIKRDYKTIKFEQGIVEPGWEKVEKCLLQYIKAEKIPIVNEYALRFHGFHGTHGNKIVPSNNISIISDECLATTNKLLALLKQKFGKNMNFVMIATKPPEEIMNDGYNIHCQEKNTGKERLLISVIDTKTECFSTVNKKGYEVGTYNTIMYFMYSQYLIEKMTSIKSDMISKIIYMENYIQSIIIKHPKELLSKSCYGYKNGLKKDLFKKRWREKATIRYID